MCDRLDQPAGKHNLLQLKPGAWNQSRELKFNFLSNVKLSVHVPPLNLLESKHSDCCGKIISNPDD
jgi:hypothetical protein